METLINSRQTIKAEGCLYMNVGLKFGSGSK